MERRKRGTTFEAKEASIKQAFELEAEGHKKKAAMEARKDTTDFEGMGTELDTLIDALEADTLTESSAETMVASILGKVDQASHQYSISSIAWNPAMTAAEKEHGEKLITLFTDDSIPLANKMMLHKASATKGGNLLHNLAVGNMEERSKEARQQLDAAKKIRR